MADINTSDSHPTGSDLFSDSEGYMSELDDSELDVINGGALPLILTAAAVRVGIAAGRSSQQCAAGIAGAIGGVGRWLEAKKN
jgi:hypothetical protein